MIAKQTCWDRGIGQPLFMAIGSTINLAGAAASLILSAQKEAINPLPFICTAMITSSMYIASNAYRAYQLYQEPDSPTSFQDKLKRENGALEITIGK